MTDEIDPSATVHPTADLEQGVTVGAGTAIWHRAQIRAGARIGCSSIIGRDVFIDAGVVIGDKVKIQNGALLYHGVTVGDGVFIGPGAILTNDRYPRAITADGDLAQAADWVVSPIVLHGGCSIGAGSVIVAGVEIGASATVGAGAVVTRDVTAHSLVVGTPARRIGWVCACGQRLHDGSGPAGAAQTSTAAPTPSGGAAGDPGLACVACGRRYGYRPGSDDLAETSGVAPGHGR